MLKKVELESKRIIDYKKVTDPALYAEILELGKKLEGKKVLQINATSAGGGVAEILGSEIPLMKDLGIDVQWSVLDASQNFFEITKLIHNGLQGQTTNLTLSQWDEYLEYNKKLSEHIDASPWDFIMVHDPQPAALLSYCVNRGNAKWLWRCHIDSRHATSDFINHFNTYLRHYDGIVFTKMEYLFGNLKPKKLAIIPMAIDPLSEKNLPMSKNDAKKRIQKFGIDTKKPIILQVSRFDPWKDPLGVITAWQIARAQIPDLQLVLAGNTSVDDPESGRIYQQVCDASRGIAGLFILADEADDADVNALQHAATVVIQKSIREGFGLTVSEASWSRVPIIGTKVGGIPEQIQDGKTGYIVRDIDESAQRIIELIRNPQKASAMGEA
jgi:trehalose synthase